MKNINAFKFPAILLVSVLLPLAVESQTYSVTGSDIGEIPFFISVNGGRAQNFSTPVNLTETATINVANQTIEQSGSFFLPANIFTASFQQSETLTIPQPPPVFPNPPNPPISENETGTETVNLFVPNESDIMTFDTGAQPIVWNGSAYVCHVAYAYSWNIPIAGTYSLVTGGQTYTGSFNFYVSGTATTFDQISAANYPASIGLGGASWSVPEFPGNYGFADVTASNGFEMQVSVTVPEPTSFAVLCFGFAGLMLFNRRQA